MPTKKCGFGFSCATMMLQPGLEPAACPNYETCDSASESTPDEEVELIRVRTVQRQEVETRRQQVQAEWEQIHERIRVSRNRAAVMMLMSRGCPQTLDGFELPDLMTSIESQIEEL